MVFIRLASLKLILIPFVAMEDPLRRAEGTEASPEKKERILGNLRETDTVSHITRTGAFSGQSTDVHSIPEALIKVVGVLITPAEHRPRDARLVTVQPNSLNA